MNKPGGAGRILRANADGTYDIKYLLGGSEKNIEGKFSFLFPFPFSLFNHVAGWDGPLRFLGLVLASSARSKEKKGARVKTQR